MTTLKERFAPFLKTIGFEDGKVAALFNADGTDFADTAMTELTSYDANRITKIKTDSKTEGFNQGHQKGVSDGATKLEKAVKAKYEIESDKIGEELIEEIITLKTNVTPPTIEEDKVKAHPAYLNMEKALKKQLKDEVTAWETKYNEREKTIAEENTFKTILAEARNYVINELKPVLPKDPKKAEMQMQLLVNALKDMQYKPNEAEAGDYIITDKEGKLKQDAHSNRIPFKNFVKSIAEGIWDMQDGQEVSSPGNSNEITDKTGKKITVKTPQTEQEFMLAIKNAQSAEERIAIADAWEKKQDKPAS